MMKTIALFVLLSVPFAAIGQYKKLQTLEISDSIVNVSVDRPGDLYLITRHGQLQHFDKNGKLLSLYKKKVLYK